MSSFTCSKTELGVTYVFFLHFKKLNERLSMSSLSSFKKKYVSEQFYFKKQVHILMVLGRVFFQVMGAIIHVFCTSSF
jgi:hypothetical protein